MQHLPPPGPVRWCQHAFCALPRERHEAGDLRAFQALLVQLYATAAYARTVGSTWRHAGDRCSYVPQPPAEGEVELRCLRTARRRSLITVYSVSPLLRVRSLQDVAVAAGRVRSADAADEAGFIKLHGVDLLLLLHFLFANGLLLSNDASLAGKGVTLAQLLAAPGCVAVDWYKLKKRRRGRSHIKVPDYSLTCAVAAACPAAFSDHLQPPDFAVLLASRARLNVRHKDLDKPLCVNLSTALVAASGDQPRRALPWHTAAQWRASAEAPAAAASEEEWNKRAEESPTLKRVKRDLSGRELLPAHRTPDIGQGKDLSVVAAHACGHRGCINFLSHCFYAGNGENKRHRRRGNRQ